MRLKTSWSCSGGNADASVSRSWGRVTIQIAAPQTSHQVLFWDADAFGEEHLLNHASTPHRRVDAPSANAAIAEDVHHPLPIRNMQLLRLLMGWSYKM
jgi:hypothetical protein